MDFEFSFGEDLKGEGEPAPKYGVYDAAVKAIQERYGNFDHVKTLTDIIERYQLLVDDLKEELEEVSPIYYRGQRYYPEGYEPVAGDEYEFAPVALGSPSPTLTGSLTFAGQPFIGALGAKFTNTQAKAYRRQNADGSVDVGIFSSEIAEKVIGWDQLLPND